MEKERTYVSKQMAKIGGYRYNNSTRYIGCWNASGKPHGKGHILFTNGVRCEGHFEDGALQGKGIITFPDGAKYEGEFFKNWFHGYGTFWRADGMKYEGEFRGGKILGLGLVTFNDGSNGFPRYEGYFQDCRLLRSENSSDVIHKARRVSHH